MVLYQFHPHKIKGPWSVPWGTPSSCLICVRQVFITTVLEHMGNLQTWHCLFSFMSQCCKVWLHEPLSPSQGEHMFLCLCYVIDSGSVTLRKTSTLKQNRHSGTDLCDLRSHSRTTVTAMDSMVHKPWLVSLSHVSMERATKKWFQQIS